MGCVNEIIERYRGCRRQRGSIRRNDQKPSRWRPAPDRQPEVPSPQRRGFEPLIGWRGGDVGNGGLGRQSCLAAIGADGEGDDGYPDDLQVMVRRWLSKEKEQGEAEEANFASGVKRGGIVPPPRPLTPAGESVIRLRPLVSETGHWQGDIEAITLISDGAVLVVMIVKLPESDWPRRRVSGCR